MSLPVAVLIWFMIYPMMVQVDFSSIVRAGKKPKGLTITLITNWLIKPFTMVFFAWLFITLVQVAINNLILLVAYAPIVTLLLGVTDLIVPFETVFLSVVLYIVIPLFFGYVSRVRLMVVAKKR